MSQGVSKTMILDLPKGFGGITHILGPSPNSNTRDHIINAATGKTLCGREPNAWQWFRFGDGGFNTESGCRHCHKSLIKADARAKGT